MQVSGPRSLHRLINTCYSDEGRARVTHSTEDRGSFKTPTLREVSRTAPYMHDGSFATLEEVVDFYNRGGGNGLGLRLPNQTLSPEPLHLSDEEKGDLVAFLGALTWGGLALRGHRHLEGVQGQTLVDIYRHGEYPKVSGGVNGTFDPNGGKIGFNILYCDGHVSTSNDAKNAYLATRRLWHRPSVCGIASSTSIPSFSRISTALDRHSSGAARRARGM